MMPPIVTINTGDLTKNKAINHKTGKTQANVAIVFFRCLRLKKSIHLSCPNKSEKIRVLAASAENKVEKRTTNEPNKKKPFAQMP